MFFQESGLWNNFLPTEIQGIEVSCVPDDDNNNIILLFVVILASSNNQFTFFLHSRCYGLIYFFMVKEKIMLCDEKA